MEDKMQNRNRPDQPEENAGLVDGAALDAELEELAALLGDADLPGAESLFSEEELASMGLNIQPGQTAPEPGEEDSEMKQWPPREEKATPVEAPEPAAEEPKSQPVPLENTVVFGSPVDDENALREDATVRLDDISRALKESADTGGAKKEKEPASEPESIEPFSQEWEPEYEQPMGEYVPPRPIQFRPRSRLQELKRKLIAGPEKRYYEISENGFGKIQAAIFLSLLVFLLSGGTTALHAMGLVLESRLRLIIFIQFFAMLVSALLGSFQMIEGVSDMFHKRFTPNSLLVFTFAACCADGIFCFNELRIPCCAAFSLAVTMSLWSSYEKRNTEIGQMDTMRKAVRLNSLVVEPDYYEGKAGILRGEGQVEDFMDHYRQTPTPEKTLSWYALAVLAVSVAIGSVGCVMHSVSLGVQVLAGGLLVGFPVSAFVSMSRPMALLERRFHAVGTVLCGWKGVKGLSGKKVFPLNHQDLFPEGTAKMNGVKFYGSRNPDQVVAYATALITADNGGLAPLFIQLLDTRNGRHYEVENFRYYGGGGIGGEVCGEPVLVGILPFLRDMGVEIPEGTRVNQAVYVAIDGELCGLFAITYQKDKLAAAGIGTLCAYKGLTPVLTTGDFMLTESFLRNRFGVNTRRIAFPPREARAELAAREPAEDAPALALVTQEGLAPVAYAATGARALRKAWNMGNVIHMLGGILGLGIMLVLAILGATDLLTPSNMLLYQLGWMVPGLLITEWTRSI